MWYQWDSTLNFYLTDFKSIQTQTQSLNRSGFHNSFCMLWQKSQVRSHRELIQMDGKDNEDTEYENTETEMHETM